MSLTKAQRAALPDDDFAVPGKRVLPIHDESHVKMAWSTLSTAKQLSASERIDARVRIKERADKLGMDTSTWNVHALAIEAMSLEVPAMTDHPNRMPFSGILTRIGEPSDKPLNGSNGKLVLLTKEAAEQALPSLLGMAVDIKEDLDGHDAKNKVGIITEAHIEGNAILIEGFIYAADFPEEAATIQAEKERLGFSYEVQAQIENLDASLWVITACKFTGAAILYKDKAAYQSTQLAANAAENEAMSKEILDAIKALSDVVTSIKAGHDEVKAELEKLKAGAKKEDGAGDENNGLNETIKGLQKQVADLAAAAETERKNAEQAKLEAGKAPERKTLTLSAASHALLKKGGLELKEGDKVSVAKVDEILKAAGVPVARRIEVKFNLDNAGLLES